MGLDRSVLSPEAELKARFVYSQGLCIGFIGMVPFGEFSDHVEIWNPGQRREGTSSIDYSCSQKLLIKACQGLSW